MFGCQAWAWIPKEHQEWKLRARAIQCIMIGYEKGVKGYRLWDLNGRTIVISRDVCRERVFPMLPRRAKPHPEEIAPPFENEWDEDVEQRTDDGEVLSLGEAATTAETEDRIGNQAPDPKEVCNPGEMRWTAEEMTPTMGTENRTDEEKSHLGEKYRSGEEVVITAEKRPRRERRTRVPCQLPCCKILKGKTGYNHCEIPDTAEEALSGPQTAEWKTAMKEELNTLREMNTWRVIKRTEVQNIVSCKWVFTLKRNVDGNII